MLARRGFFFLVLAASGCVTEDDKNLSDTLLDLNKKVGTAIHNSMEKVDIYVANRRYSDIPNKSRIVLYNAFSLSEGGKAKYSPQVGAKLHLPNVQEKVQLTFTSYDEDELDQGINENRYQPAPEESIFSTSLALFQQLGKIKVEFRPRVELRDRILTSHLFKFSSEATHGGFVIAPELHLFARSTTGTGQFFAINLNYQFSKSESGTLLNEEQYTDGNNTLSTNHGIKWSHQHDADIAVENALVFESNNRPSYHLDQYVFSSTFKHELVKNILNYRLIPHATFSRENHFHPIAGLDMRVDLIF